MITNYTLIEGTSAESLTNEVTYILQAEAPDGGRHWRLYGSPFAIFDGESCRYFQAVIYQE